MKLSMPRFDQASVLVVGDVMLDRYWHGGTSRISPEAPVPVVRVDQVEDRPGGAANVALNIAALGAPATLVGVTGVDEARQSLTDSLAAAGVGVFAHMAFRFAGSGLAMGARGSVESASSFWAERAAPRLCWYSIGSTPSGVTTRA